MAGSCNRLICLVGYNSISYKSISSRDNIYQDYWLQLWNPTTRKISQRISYFRNSRSFIFNYFGWDDSTNTFKVVASLYIHNSYRKSKVKVLTIGDNVWRNIDKAYKYGCLFLNTNFNWLAIYKQVRFNWSYYVNDITVEDIVIVSLDLRTKTYNKYRLPQGFDELLPEDLTIGVLKECLCLSYSYKETNIVIW